MKRSGGRPEEVSLPAELDPVTRTHLDRATDSLAEEFVGIFSRETVARFMSESLGLLGHARFNEFLPVLAHRFARERLRALGQAGGEIASGPARGTSASPLASPARAAASSGSAAARRTSPTRRVR